MLPSLITCLVVLGFGAAELFLAAGADLVVFAAAGLAVFTGAFAAALLVFAFFIV